MKNEKSKNINIEDNISSHAYYHFISFVKELHKKNYIDFALPIQEILERIRYKGKSYSQILSETYETIWQKKEKKQ